MPMLETAFRLAKLLPPSRLASIASRLKLHAPGEDLIDLILLVGSAPAKAALQDFLAAWQAANIPGETGAYILQTAAHARQQTLVEQQIELVLTGPSTPFVSTRRTEQVLLDIVHGAKSELFLVSFVTYRWDSIINALRDACNRGVNINVLLEASKLDGGSLGRDQSEGLRNIVPQASIYQWTSRSTEFADGKVHAKIAVSDEETAFLTCKTRSNIGPRKRLRFAVVAE